MKLIYKNKHLMLIQTQLTIFFIIIISIYYLSDRFRNFENQSGGSRSAVFSRWHYTPEYPMISRLDLIDYNLFSKTYNTAGPLKIIVGRPYRNYMMSNGNWDYPWHFPEQDDHSCLKLAESRCNEDIITLNKSADQKLGGLGVTAPKDLLRTSKCFDYVYKQCRNGINSLLINGEK